MNSEDTTHSHKASHRTVSPRQSVLARGVKNHFTTLGALAAIVLTGTFFFAGADGSRSERNRLEGTWMATGEPGATPGLITFLPEGRVIWSRPPTVLTGPGSYALASTGHGEWVQTGRQEFSYTTYFLTGTTTAEFAVLIKVTEIATLNRTSDAFSQTGTVSGFDPAGNLLFSFPGPVTSGTRIVAGQ